jgi:hypothetical protein
LKWIGFTVSEKVNPGEPGGTKPRVRLPGTGFGQRITLADVNSLERTAGLKDSRVAEEAELFVKKAAVYLSRRQRSFFENTACCLFWEQAFFVTRFELATVLRGGQVHVIAG